MERPRPIAINDIGNGAVAELYERNLAKILPNIEDPNTLAAKPRKLTIALTFATDEDRQSFRISATVTPLPKGGRP